jgi:hypothetical protein
MCIIELACCPRLFLGILLTVYGVSSMDGWGIEQIALVLDRCFAMLSFLH